MGRVCRLALGLVLALGAARMAGYLAYALLNLPAEFETFNLEAKMVLLADRARAGGPLYPAWREYPHVANFFGPLYFLLVGLIARASGAGFHGLFLIGRGVTFGSGLTTSALLGERLGRRYGRWAAIAGAVLSLGAAPMYGFSVMARPDLMAEMLGLLGFFLSGLRSRGGCALGVLILVAAALTKQTALLFLLAAASALLLEGERVRAAAVLGGGSAAIVLVVAAATLTVEPRFARDLLGESRTPWDFVTWLRTLVRALRWSPDLFAFAAVGSFLWARRRSRDVRSLALASWILAVALTTSAKRGADLNYYLSVRIVEGLAAGAFWHAASAATTLRGRVAATLTALVLAVSLLQGTGTAVELASAAWRARSESETAPRRAAAGTLRQLVARAGDPGVRMLSDAGLLDAARRDRAVFGDPWLFHLLVETGQIDPAVLKRRIDAEEYDLIVTTTDLMRPEYARYEFGLPMVLVERIRGHYAPRGTQGGLFFYTRRGEGQGSVSLDAP